MPKSRDSRPAVMALFLILATLSFSEKKTPPKPSAADKCPVCGMFISKYQDFLAEVIYKDGTAVFFDGAKDMFKYCLSPEKYHPSRKKSDIDSIYVTDYYSLDLVDAYQAYFVLGSDIYGPMGRELIPLSKQAEANEFMKDHKGTSLLTFGQITLDTLERLD